MTYALPIYASFSGGRSSAVMVAELARRGHPLQAALFCNTGMESLQTYDFIAAYEERVLRPLGVPLVVLEWWCEETDQGKPQKRTFREVSVSEADRNGEVFFRLVRAAKAVPNPKARFCTSEMKVETQKSYLRAKGFARGDYYKALGIRACEHRRIASIRGRGDKSEAEIVMPLVDWGIKQADVLRWWKQEGTLGLGFDPADPSIRLSNCEGCFYGSQGEFHRVIKNTPARADRWQEMEDWVSKYKETREQAKRREWNSRKGKWIAKHLNRGMTPEENKEFNFMRDYSWRNLREWADQTDAGGTLGLDFSAGGCGDGECGTDL